MITVPKELTDRGHSKDWTKLPTDQLKYECEQHTLRKLAFYLEKIGRDLPPALPPLNKENRFALNN